MFPQAIKFFRGCEDGKRMHLPKLNRKKNAVDFGDSMEKLWRDRAIVKHIEIDIIMNYVSNCRRKRMLSNDFFWLRRRMQTLSV